MIRDFVIIGCEGAGLVSVETRIDGNGGCFELDRRSKMSSKLAIKTSKSRPGDRPKSSGDIRISTKYMIVSYERENG